MRVLSHLVRTGMTAHTLLSASREPMSAMDFDTFASSSPTGTLADTLPPLASSSRRVYLVRHGETDWNQRGLLQGGGYDIELNTAGKEQASKVKEQLAGLPIGVVASSHLARASQTADMIAQDLESALRIIHPKLGEMNFGNLEGRALFGPESDEYTQQKFRTFDGISFQHKDACWPGEGGESVNDVVARGGRGLDQVLRSNPSAKHVCVVSHGRWNRIMLMKLLGVEDHKAMTQGNACINVIDVDEEGQWKARVINHVDHLPASA